MQVYTIENLRAEFELKHPQIERMARSHFPFMPPQKKDDATSNAVALCWKGLRAAYIAGKIDQDNAWFYIKECLWLAIKATKAGRTVEQVRDQGERTNRRDAYDLKSYGQLGTGVVEYFASVDAPVPDQVQFRIDIPALLSRLTERHRTVVLMLIDGLKTGEVAQILGVTPAVVSQFRAKFYRLMQEYLPD